MENKSKKNQQEEIYKCKLLSSEKLQKGESPIQSGVTKKLSIIIYLSPYNGLVTEPTTQTIESYGVHPMVW
jgi:hypothetical protein